MEVVEVVSAKQELGKFGEAVAARHLEAQGMVVIDRRWRCRHGEIDLVARDGRCLVFVEVKVRSSMALGGPLEAVTPAKVRRLRLLVGAWLGAHDVHAPELRIDVVGILRGGDELCVEHVRAVG